MKSLRLAAVLLLTAILVSLAVVPVFAQTTGTDDGQVVLGGSYTLRSGQVLDGDLAVFGGSANIEEGAVVRGDVLHMGGSLDLNGTVQGDLAAFGGSTDIGPTAAITGDVVHFGGSMSIDPRAEVGGDVRQGGTFDLPGIWSNRFVLPMLDQPGVVVPGIDRSPGNWLVAAFLGLIRAVMMVAALGALALVVSLIWPAGIERMGRAGEKAPFMAIGAGILTWLVGFALVALLAVTICLIPVAILLALVLLAAGILSWIVTGWWVGRKLLAVLNVARPTTVLEATVGTILVAGVYVLIGVIPCVNFIYGLLVASFGVGAIALTRFGTREYPVPLAGAPVTMEMPAALPAGQTTAVAPQDDRDLTN